MDGQEEVTFLTLHLSCWLVRGHLKAWEEPTALPRWKSSTCRKHIRTLFNWDGYTFAGDLWELWKNRREVRRLEMSKEQGSLYEHRSHQKCRWCSLEVKIRPDLHLMTTCVPEAVVLWAAGIQHRRWESRWVCVAPPLAESLTDQENPARGVYLNVSKHFTTPSWTVWWHEGHM